MLLSWERQSFLGMLLFWDDAFPGAPIYLGTMISWERHFYLGMMLS